VRTQKDKQVEKEEVEEIAKQYEAYIEKEQEKIAPEERWRTTMQSRCVQAAAAAQRVLSR
jgi:hypothetical protein